MYWHMLPEAAQGRKVIWDGIDKQGRRIVDQAFPKALRRSQNEHEMKIELLNGSIWQVVGSDNYNSLIGANPVGIVFSEWSVAKPSAWDYMRPILAENGGWALFIYTPRGRNHGHEIYQIAKGNQAWFAEILTVDETKILAPELIEAERASGMDESMIEQEYYCSFEGALVGSFYGKIINELERTGRITDVPYDPSVPVHTFWDLGHTDDTAIWFAQVVRGEVHIIDAYANHGKDIRHYVDVIKDKPYQYGLWHWIPHDARAKTLAANGRSTEQQLNELGLKTRIVPQLTVQDGIQAARVTLPNCWFDSAKTKEGLESLRQYQREWDEDNRMFKVHPKHDWSCLTGDTMVLTRYGMRPIMNLTLSGEVLTPCGWKKYCHPRITKKAAQLVAVRFEDGLTVRCTPDHLFLTVSGWRFAADLSKGSLIQSSLTRLRSISMAVFIACGHLKSTCREAVRSFTDPFGLWPLGLCLPAAISITETEIHSITCSPTWSAWTEASIYQDQMRGIKKASTIPQGNGPLRGMVPKRDDSGIAGMQSGAKAGLNGSTKISRASIAGLSILLSSVRAAIHNVFARTIAKPLRIESVTPLTETADVWCITVPDGEVYSLANGAVTHNSHFADSFRYLSLAWREEMAPKPPDPPRFALDQTFNEIRDAARRRRLAYED